MEIKITEIEKDLKIEKNVEDDLKNFILNFKIILALIIFIIFICFFTISLFGLFFSYFLLSLQAFFLYRQRQYMYCNEIIEIEKNIMLKFTFKDCILYEKIIELNDVEKIYIVKKRKFHSIFRKQVDNKILAEPFEQRRRLKILLFNGEIYSCGGDVNDSEIKKVIFSLKNYFNKMEMKDLIEM